MHNNMKQIALYRGHTRQIFALSLELWNFPEYARIRSEGWRYRSNPLKISAIGLKFSMMTHTTLERVAT